mgnify:CR=1 FL=1
MIQQPDQFRVYVRLPFSDKYLENEAAAKIREELKQLFRNPLIQRKITPNQTRRIHPTDSSLDQR